MSDSWESATEYVIAALEAKGSATRDDFDVAAIVAASREIADGWDFGAIERATFWRIASCHLKV
ncbi:hypothetical protein [Nocardia sp. NPDC052566]|uniref:hypothetical protein n=1 Tax=Nocardia sp. NPDC052566 TaxID=3364330 RepID=UPI0037C9EA48